MPTFSLTMKETLVKGEQLTDEHIYLAQRLLKKHFHHIDGLQPSVLSQTNGFTPVQQEAIQIHHVPGHWVTSSSTGGKLAVYDSKFTGGDLSSSLTYQLASIYRLLAEREDEDGDDIDPPILTVEIPYVQQQKGIADCGLFAVAFAVHLAFGDDVSKLTFDQSKMRQHLIKCFQKKEMQPFPLTRAAPRSQSYFPFREIELFCSCQMPETYGDMIECDKCGDWYHMDCVGLKSPPPEQEQWNCSKCSV